MAISVVVCVGDATADALVRRLKPRMEALRTGPGNQGDPDMGSLVTAAHRDKVRRSRLVVAGLHAELAGLARLALADAFHFP